LQPHDYRGEEPVWQFRTDVRTMRSPPAEIGAGIDDIDSPALIVDLNAFERNLDKMAKVARGADVRLRPHAKTHKCPEIAKRQIALGAVGQCVQKVGEAEALASAGIRDILVSNEIVGESKLRRLAGLAEEARIALCFDDPEQVDAASRVARERGSSSAALSRSRSGWSAAGFPAQRRRGTSHAGLRMRRTCASKACRRIMDEPSIFRPPPSVARPSRVRSKQFARRWRRSPSPAFIVRP
jgi:diaminopimelate decarboxylase